MEGGGAFGRRRFSFAFNRLSIARAMKWILAIVPVAFWSVSASAADRRAVLYDPVSLNIGVTCHWQPRCMERQHLAMNSALTYVAKRKPPPWKIQRCNRNANRGGVRVDWLGYDHCIRNSKRAR